MADTKYTLTDPQSGKTYRGTYGGDLSKLGPAEIDNLLKWHRDQDAKAKAINDKAMSILTGAFAKPASKAQNPAPSDIFTQGVKRSKEFATKTFGIRNIPDFVTLNDPSDGTSTKIKWDLARLPTSQDADTLLKTWREQKAFDASALGGAARFTKSYIDHQNAQPVVKPKSPRIDPSALPFTPEDWQTALDQGLTVVRTSDGKSMPLQQAYPLAMRAGLGNKSHRRDVTDNANAWATNYGKNPIDHPRRSGQDLETGLGSLVKQGAEGVARLVYKLPPNWQADVNGPGGQLMQLATGLGDLATYAVPGYGAAKGALDLLSLAASIKENPEKGINDFLNSGDPVQALREMAAGNWGEGGTKLANFLAFALGGTHGIHNLTRRIDPLRADFKPALDQGGTNNGQERRQEGRQETGLLKPGEGDGPASPSPAIPVAQGGMKPETLTTGNGTPVTVSSRMGVVKAAYADGPKEVQARIFDHEGHTLAVYNSGEGNRPWSVIETTTGRLLATGQSEAGAILYAREHSGADIANGIKSVAQGQPPVDTSTAPVVVSPEVKPELPTAAAEPLPHEPVVTPELSPEPVIRESHTPPPAGMERGVKGEKPSKRTGLTPTQTKVLVESLDEVLREAYVNGNDNVRTSIKIPGDGEFTVNDSKQAMSLRKAVDPKATLPKWVPEWEYKRAPGMASEPRGSTRAPELTIEQITEWYGGSAARAYYANSKILEGSGEAFKPGSWQAVEALKEAAIKEIDPSISTLETRVKRSAEEITRVERVVKRSRSKANLAALDAARAEYGIRSAELISAREKADDRLRSGDFLQAKEVQKTSTAKATSGNDHYTLDSKFGSPRPTLPKNHDAATISDSLRKISKGIYTNVFDDLKSKKAAGMFQWGGSKTKFKGKWPFGRIRINEKLEPGTLKHADVLSHELGHAIEYYVSNYVKTNNTFDVLFNATKPIAKSLEAELKNVTLALEGPDRVNADPAYFNKRAELFARFMQATMFYPDLIERYAPKSAKMLADLAKEHPAIADFIKVAQGDLIERNPGLMFLPDRRQGLIRDLGHYLGTKTYRNEIVYQARRAQRIAEVEDLIRTHFKDVKDDPAQLMIAAEGIQETRGGVPIFGTKIVKQIPHDPLEVAALEANGWEHVGVTKEGLDILEKWRVTPAQGEMAFNGLSPEGKQLIKDYTANINEAKDLFAREKAKAHFQVQGEIQGYVHHFFENSAPDQWRRKFLKTKRASARNKRGESEGFVLDLGRATAKNLVDLHMEKEWNQFMHRQLALTAEPLEAGARQPTKPGWVAIEGSPQAGFFLPGEARSRVIAPDGSSVKVKLQSYQIPKEIWETYQKIRTFDQEASTLVKTINEVSRYWMANVLLHPGTWTTNFISGGIQYGGKIVQDMILDSMEPGNLMRRTRANIAGILETMTPSGWNKAPDWVYGGSRTNFYQQFVDMPHSSIPGDTAINQLMTGYQGIERFWKKAIMNAEQRKTGLPLDSEEFIGHVGHVIDSFAYNYENIPDWLRKWSKSPTGSAIKPFVIYPYKMTKMLTEMAGGIFDKNATPQDRIARTLALTTILGTIGAYNYWVRNGGSMTSDMRGDLPDNEPSKDKAAAGVDSTGRVYVGGDQNGNDLYISSGKYPFLNAEAFLETLARGRLDDAQKVLQDVYGGVSPAGELVLGAMGYNSQYSGTQPVGARIGKGVGSLFPLSRVVADTKRALDPVARQQPDTFLEGLWQSIPLPGFEPKEKTYQVKLREGERSGSKTTRTEPYPKYPSDEWLKLLLGVNIKRVNRDWYERFVERSAENAEKKNEKESRRNADGTFAPKPKAQPKRSTPLLVRPRAGGRSSFGRSSHLGVFRRK